MHLPSTSIPPVAVLSLALGGGCVDPRCYEASDCPAPMICGPAGECTYECVGPEDCPENFRCEAHACVPVSSGTVECPDDMVVVAQAFCVDRYEASRSDATGTSAGSDGSVALSAAGVLPWQVADNATAQAACEAAGKRLCTPQEWQFACAGPDRTAYAYGDTYEPETCNGIDTFGWPGFRLLPTGSLPGCTNDWGVFDINGNLWEHTAGGSDLTVRGGAFNCVDSAALHRCDYVPRTWGPSARGFRCCLTPPDGEGG